MRTFDGYMHGVNLGGWLSQNADTSETHYNQFITEADIAYITSLGLDHVRVPVDYMVLETEDGQRKEEGFAYIDRCLSWCQANGIRMILDLHKTYGYSFSLIRRFRNVFTISGEPLPKDTAASQIPWHLSC